MPITIILEPMDVDDSSPFWICIKALLLLLLTLIAVKETAKLTPRFSPIVCPIIVFAYLRWAIEVSFAIYFALWVCVVVICTVYYHLYYNQNTVNPAYYHHLQNLYMRGLIEDEEVLERLRIAAVTGEMLW